MFKLSSFPNIANTYAYKSLVNLQSHPSSTSWPKSFVEIMSSNKKVIPPKEEISLNLSIDKIYQIIYPQKAITYTIFKWGYL